MLFGLAATGPPLGGSGIGSEGVRVGETQHLSFVDPKGLLHTQGFDDPKVEFAKAIKDLEKRLKPGNPELVLNSFILSTTSFRQINWWDKLKTEAAFAKAHVLLQKDEPDTYVAKMFDLISKSIPQPHA